MKYKKAALAIAFPLSMLIAGQASAGDWGQYLGCCLSPNPIKCLKEVESGAQFNDIEEIDKLTMRISALSKAGAFDEALKSKAALGLENGPYSTSCNATETLDMFEKRTPLNKIQSTCNIKSAKSNPQKIRKLK